MARNSCGMVKFDWIRSDKPVVSQINLLGTPACRIGERPDKCSSTPVNNRADSMVRQTEEKKSPRKRKCVKLEQQEEEREKPSHRNHKSRHANDRSSTSCSSSSSSDGEENDAQANNELLALTVNALTQLLAKVDKKTKKKLLKATVQSLSPSSKEKQRQNKSKSHIKSERTHRRSSPHKRREHKRRKNGEKTEEANSPGPSSSLTSTPRLSSFPSIVPNSFSPMFTHSSSSSEIGREKAKFLTTKANSGNKVTRKPILDNSHIASTDPSLIPLPNGSFVANSLDEFLRPPPPPPLSFVQALEQGQCEMNIGISSRKKHLNYSARDAERVRLENCSSKMEMEGSDNESTPPATHRPFYSFNVRNTVGNFEPGIVPTNTAEKNDLVSVEERMSVLVGFRAEEARKKRIEEELMQLLVDKKDDLFQRKVLMKLKENTRNDSNGGVSDVNVQNKVNGSKDDCAVIGGQQTNPTTDEDSREREEVVEQTQHREEMVEQTQSREELGKQQHREELAEQTRHRDKLAEQTQYREELAEQTQHREELAEQTQHREELAEQTQHRQPMPIKWSLWAVDDIVKPISRAQELENYRNKNRRAANSKKLKSTKLNFTQCEENDASRDVIESQQIDGTDCIDLDGKCFSFEQRQQTLFEESNNNGTISDAVDCPFDAEAFGAHSVMGGDEQLVSMLGLAYQLDGTIVSDVMETFDSTLKGEGDYTNDVTNTCCSTINGEGGHVENSSNDVVNAFWDTFCSTINVEAGHAENDSNEVVTAVENQAGIEDETGTCVGQQNTFDSITEEHDEDYTKTRDSQQNMFNSVEAEVEYDTEIRDDTEMRVDQQNAFDLVGNEERVEDDTETRDDHVQINSLPDEVCDEFCGDQSLRVPYSPLNANEYDDEIEEGEVVDDGEDNRTVSDNQQNWCEHGSTTFEASLDERKQQQKWKEQQVDKRIETGTMFPEERLVSREEEVGENDFTLRLSVPAPMTPPRLASPTDEQRIPSPKTPPLQWTSYRSCIKMLQRREKRGKTNVLDVITLDEEYDL